MGSFARKVQRQKKKDAEKAMATQVALFGKLPDKCLTCEETFDKTNKEMVTTWSVVVREKEDVVRLYCPTCWEKAIQIVDDFKKHVEERNE